MNTPQKGFSLVELMVALVLGLVLLTGIGNLFLATNRTLTLQNELSRIQENARLAIDILGADIRSASYTGCPPQAELANSLQADHLTRGWMTHFDKGILGFSAGNEATSRLDSNATSEAIIVHSIDREQATAVSGHSTGTATVSLATQHGYDNGDLLALVSPDCGQVSIFRAGEDTDSQSVTHPSSASGNLYNCTNDLKGDFSCHTGSTEASSINHQGSELAPLKSYAYYLRDSNSVPTLYRKRAGEYASGNTINAEAVVEGIENLRFLYGVDSDNDGIANQYQTASDVGLFSDNWSNVTSVKLELLARSFQEVAEEPQPYFFGGQRIVPDDRFVRRNFITTIELRNRSQ